MTTASGFADRTRRAPRHSVDGLTLMAQESGLGCKHEKRATANRAFIMEFDCSPYPYTVELVVAVDGVLTPMTGNLAAELFSSKLTVLRRTKSRYSAFV
jgi:hypothetical protein